MTGVVCFRLGYVTERVNSPVRYLPCPRTRRDGEETAASRSVSIKRSYSAGESVIYRKPGESEAAQAGPQIGLYTPLVTHKCGGGDKELHVRHDSHLNYIPLFPARRRREGQVTGLKRFPVGASTSR